MKETEFEEFLVKLKKFIKELSDYYNKYSEYDADIARDVKNIIEEDIINDKREYDDKIKSIIRLYHIVDFVYGLIFTNDELYELSEIMRNIMNLIEEYEFLSEWNC